MTQPAVTFQIRQLEERFNTPLFNRENNKITLTQAGQLVQTYADQILQTYSEMDIEIGELTSNTQSPLIVGASTTIGEYFIPKIIGAYQSQYSDIKVRLNVANSNRIIHMVENNQIDLGIIESPVTNKSLITEVIWDDKLVVICPVGHPLTQKKRVNASELTDYPFIAREEGSGTRDVIQHYLQYHGISVEQLDIIMEFGSPESIKNAVAAGLGISILSVATMEKELALGSFAVIPLGEDIHRCFSIIRQKKKFKSNTIEQFIKFTKQQCNALQKSLTHTDKNET